VILYAIGLAHDAFFILGVHHSSCLRDCDYYIIFAFVCKAKIEKKRREWYNEKVSDVRKRKGI